MQNFSLKAIDLLSRPPGPDARLDIQRLRVCLMKPESSMPHSESLCNISEQLFLQCEVVSLTPNPQAGGPLLID